MTNPFDPTVIEAVTEHMNTDHAADTLVICQGVGNCPAGTAARMDSFDGEGAEFIVTVGEHQSRVRLPWSRKLSQRAEVRPEIVEMFRESRRILGIDD